MKHVAPGRALVETRLLKNCSFQINLLGLFMENKQS